MDIHQECPECTARLALINQYANRASQLEQMLVYVLKNYCAGKVFLPVEECGEQLNQDIGFEVTEEGTEAYLKQRFMEHVS